jgi:hypothetical protein
MNAAGRPTGRGTRPSINSLTSRTRRRRRPRSCIEGDRVTRCRKPKAGQYKRHDHQQVPNKRRPLSDPFAGTRARPRRQAQERHRRHQPDEIQPDTDDPNLICLSPPKPLAARMPATAAAPTASRARRSRTPCATACADRSRSPRQPPSLTCTRSSRQKHRVAHFLRSHGQSVPPGKDGNEQHSATHVAGALVRARPVAPPGRRPATSRSSIRA